jgi:serine/threonine protein kinase
MIFCPQGAVFWAKKPNILHIFVENICKITLLTNERWTFQFLAWFQNARFYPLWHSDFQNAKVSQLVDFLDKVHTLDPQKRPTVNACLTHPFIVDKI